MIIGKHRIPWTFCIGLAAILALEALLAYDVIHHSRGVVETDADVHIVYQNQRITVLDHVARYVAINMTPLAWPAYLLLLDGVLILQRGHSPIRARKHHFAMLCLASIFIWCVFDAINFNRGMLAWNYIGIPPRFGDRLVGYLWAFACICPGMFLSAQTLLNTRFFDRMRGRPWQHSRGGWWTLLLIGVAMFAWPLFSANPMANLTLWTSLVFLLDPINYQLGRPSLLCDWTRGWYGRTIALMLGGLMCGLLWEFWNFWALAKWTYHLPFLGRFEHIRYFQMPLPGLLGFLPFGAECWVMWQTIRIPFDGLVEPIEDERDVL